MEMLEISLLLMSIADSYINSGFFQHFFFLYSAELFQLDASTPKSGGCYTLSRYFLLQVNRFPVNMTQKQTCTDYKTDVK
jgi:hypothetical protein